MSYIKRKEAILNLLKLSGMVTFQELLQELNTSSATIRRDLSKMESENLLIRYRGGAIQKHASVEAPLDKRQSINIEDKKKIGKMAAKEIQSNELIFIGSGSTTFAMINYINDTSISVITNGIPHAEALQAKGIQTFLLCGFLKNKSRTLIGKETVKMIKSFNFSKAFLSANGISSDKNILSVDEYEYEVKQAAIENAKNVYILVDKTKFNKTAMYSTSLDSNGNIKILTTLE